MTRLSAHGISADLATGWEGQIYLRPPEVAASTGAGATQGAPTGQVTGGWRPTGSTPSPVQYPVLQLANFTLPAQRGDFGGGAVEQMAPHNLFVSLFEYGPESAGTALFASAEAPWPVSPDAFGPNRLQRPLPGQGGAQWFFTVHRRPFCLYVVLGSYLLRRAQVRPLNRALGAITIS